METTTNTNEQPGQHYCCNEVGFFFSFVDSMTKKQIQKLHAPVSDNIYVSIYNWMFVQSNEGETENTVQLVKSSNLLNKRVDDMTM